MLCKRVAGGSENRAKNIVLFLSFLYICAISLSISPPWAGVVAWSALGGLLGASWSILGLSWSHLGGIGPKPMCGCFSRKACGRGLPFSSLRGVGVDPCCTGAVQTGLTQTGNILRREVGAGWDAPPAPDSPSAPAGFIGMICVGKGVCMLS